MRLFPMSKWLHKYFGLLLLCFFMWMAFSGIFLNHPQLIGDFSVPGWLIPGVYHIKNWNRSALIKMIFADNPETAFVCGKEGVWKTSDGGKSFSPMRDGFPSSRFYGKTNDILLVKGEPAHLLAGTDGGLYACELSDEKWRKISLGPSDERVVKIIAARDRLIAFTPSHAYRAAFPDMNFSLLPLPRMPDEHRVSWIRLFFNLHSGAVWGKAGRLLYDIVGVAAIWLCLSGFYLWYRPRRRHPGTPPRRKLFKFCYNYHLKVGIWAAAVLLVIGGTGLFMRPPLLALLSGGVSDRYYPGFCSANPWEEKIHNALYHPGEDQIIIEAADGVWAAPGTLDTPFTEKKLSVDVFVMGATVFEPSGEDIVVGSFNGIFRIPRATGKAVNLITGEEAERVSSVRPAEFMVTGYFQTPAGEEFVTGHEQGLLTLQGLPSRFAMPEALGTDYRMPLWNYMFELHNGRIFQGWIGKWYILIAPLGAMAFLMIVVTGIFDWCCRKSRKKRNGEPQPRAKVTAG